MIIFMKKGFTLIELLAVIVILAVIALIVTPVITDIIGSVNKSAASSSVDGYIDAVEKSYLRMMFNNKVIASGTYELSELSLYDISFKGNGPSDGWVKLDNGHVVDYSLKIDDYVITKDDEISVGEIKDKKLKYSTFINAKDKGVKGDGVTDDTSAINSLFNLCSDCVIYFPEGTYLVSSFISPNSNQVITGDKEKTVFLANEGFARGKNLFYISRKNNVEIRNITVSGNSSVNTSEKYGYDDQDGIHLFDVWNSSDVLVENCIFKDNIYVGIRLINTQNFKAVNNKFLNIDCGIISLGNGLFKNIKIIDNYFEQHEHSEPISFFGTGSTNEDIWVINNTLKNKTYACSIMLSDRAVSFSNVIIKSNSMDGLAAGISVSNLNGGKIFDNKIINTTSGSGIGIKASSNVDIYENYIENVMQDGFNAKDITNINIYENSIINSGHTNVNYALMRISGVVSNVNVYNNVLDDTDNEVTDKCMALYSTGDLHIYNNDSKKCIYKMYSSSQNIVLDDVSSDEYMNQGTNNTINLKEN